MVSRADDSILIAGAGPAGLTLALELARRGIKVRIVERDEGVVPISESRALGVNARTLALLEPSGVTEPLLAEAIPLEEFRVQSADKQLLKIRPADLGGRFPALCILPQGLTERLLLERLRSYDIEPEWQTSITTIEGGVEAPLATLLSGDGSGEMVRPNMLVGADGAHSLVRKSCGFDFPGEALESRFFLADFRYAETVDTGFAEINLQNPGVLGRLPVRPDVLRYISTLPDFERRIIHPSHPLEETWRSDFRVSFRHVEPMSRGKVYLLGDAAHVHSPIGARGMNLGIEDACWLAWLISQGREAEFSQLRLPSVRKVLAQTRRLTGLITIENPLALALRNNLFALVGTMPPIARLALRNISGLDTPAPTWIDSAT
ncbi:NAD(P)/FAD-dependent oxidoreductase [Sinorhizobium sp. BG8]|uniref:FAD-dependent oxidoreductase n=1 Tax=Sinorhizobium sp. BG8 TaxID=2613773 RepID=UPI00193E097A|nr:NAD(P)/FAD-dependent oxidoreductase [Sinorhizobium sp. BG8]QRM55969.1 FAD-dependent monooxygenase [Sinorhizobium sp. BG8]